MKKIVLFFLSLFAFLLPLSAKNTFSNLTLNNEDEVLFNLSQELTGTYSYSSLFYANIANGTDNLTTELITYFPERMELLNNGEVLQIRNRFGTADYSMKKNALTWTAKSSSIPLDSLPIPLYSVSPDGKWYCKIEKTDLCLGHLILVNVESGKEEVLCEKILNSYESIPVKWAPDSSVLIYEKNNSIYFCNPSAIFRGVEIEEQYRKIGRGTINSVYWASSKYLAYADDYLLYRINAKELYTVGLYSGIIGQGKAMGRLPSQFNPQSDKFSTNEDVTSIVVMANSRLFSYYRVTSISCDYMDVVYSRPYTDSSASLMDSYVFWTKEGNPVLWQEKLPYSSKSECASVFTLNNGSDEILSISDSGKPFLSPDGTKLAFYAGQGIYIYDLGTFMCLAKLEGEKVINALWSNKNEIIVGGEKTVRKWNLLNDSVSTICLSSCEKGFWQASNNGIIAQTNPNSYFSYDMKKRIWSPVQGKVEVLKQTQNGKYRIFTGNTGNKYFTNALFVRTLSDMAVTKPVFPDSVKKMAEPVKIALVFDAYDNADGLPEILSALKKYNVSATFFLNGEFIRRYPLETQQIVLNGHECASLFFAQTDLTDDSFVINEDFIRRGLARNEDEFYQCTNKELSLFWHAPYYLVSKDVISYGEKAGYTYVENFLSHPDFSSGAVKSEILIQEYCAQMIKQKGGILPVTVGFSQGYYIDPLYHHIDLLISALIDSGFEITTLSGM